MGADAAIWCATGIASTPKTFRFRKERAQLIDEVALPVIAEAVTGRAAVIPRTETTVATTNDPLIPI